MSFSRPEVGLWYYQGSYSTRGLIGIHLHYWSFSITRGLFGFCCLFVGVEFDNSHSWSLISLGFLHYQLLSPEIFHHSTWLVFVSFLLESNLIVVLLGLWYHRKSSFTRGLFGFRFLFTGNEFDYSAFWFLIPLGFFHHQNCFIGIIFSGDRFEYIELLGLWYDIIDFRLLFFWKRVRLWCFLVCDIIRVPSQ